MNEELDNKKAMFDAAKREIDAAEAAGSVARPRKVLAMLEQSRAKQWMLEWCEYVIVFNCLTRRKPARTHGMMSRVQQMYLAEGSDGSEFKALSKRVSDILKPDNITPHGYKRTFDTMDQAEVLESMQSVLKTLDQFGHPIFLYSGTLLGMVRDGALIGHDDDIDVAVFIGEHTQDTIAENWLTFKKQLYQAGLLSPDGAATNSPAFEITTPSVRVDLFPAWSENGAFSVYPHSLGEMREADVFPMEKLDGTDLNLPRDYDAFLVHSYGENWRVPDPYWHFEWPTAKQKFECLFRVNYAL